MVSSYRKMISRRRILSKSRDDLTSDPPYQQEEEEDVWTQKDKLFKVISIIKYSGGALSLG